MPYNTRSHRPSTDDLNPDLPIRRAIRQFAGQERDTKKVEKIWNLLGFAYTKLEPRNAIEHFSHTERSIANLKRIQKAIEQLNAE